MTDNCTAGQPDLTSLILQLEAVGAVKFGEFQLKSGLSSPVYFDLRILVAHPRLLSRVAELLSGLQAGGGAGGSSSSLVCGVPYTALPIATLMSVAGDRGMVVRRKEAKAYGTKRMVEGEWTAGQEVLVVEDVVTTGGSVAETAELLRQHGMTVRECVVLLDRQQGARENLERRGVELHSLVTVSQVLEVLEREKRITQEVANSVRTFLGNNQFGSGAQPTHPSQQNGKSQPDPGPIAKMPFEVRAAASGIHPVARRLFDIMTAKRSNLCVALDVTRAAEVVRLATAVADSAAVIKLHADIVTDWTTETETALKSLAAEKSLLLFEDRKLGDIGNTARLQAAGFTSWADLVTVHGLPGPGVLDGLLAAAKATGGGRDVAALIVAEMSTAGNLATGQYTRDSVALGLGRPEAVAGFICQSPLLDSTASGGRPSSSMAGLVQMTPGVKRRGQNDGGDQRYNCPRSAVLERGADLVIVGRGITEAADPAAEAEACRAEAFAAYLERTEHE